nr:MAG TPA: Head Tail Connector Protein [Caudoviricetes sp.]
MPGLDLAKFKKLLGIESMDNSKDFELQYILDDVEVRVLDYCHIEELPTGLKSTCYRMAIDLYRNENIGQEERDTVVTSLSEGNTSTSFKAKEQDKAYLESILKDYRLQLNRYRKLVWE